MELLDVRGASDDVLSAIAKTVAVNVITARPNKRKKSDTSTDLSSLGKSNGSASKVSSLLSQGLTTSPPEFTSTAAAFTHSIRIDPDIPNIQTCGENNGLVTEDVANEKANVDFASAIQIQNIDSREQSRASLILAPTSTLSEIQPIHHRNGGSVQCTHSQANGQGDQISSIAISGHPQESGTQSADTQKNQQNPGNVSQASCISSLVPENITVIPNKVSEGQNGVGDFITPCAEGSMSVKPEQKSEPCQSALQVLNSVQQGAMPSIVEERSTVEQPAMTQV